MVESKKSKDLTKYPQLPEYLDGCDNPCVVIYGGSFAPIHLNHIRTILFSYETLRNTYNYDILGVFLVPTHDTALRKKFNGNLPISKEVRKQLIDMEISQYEWMIPYYGVIDDKDNEGLGKATREIVNFIKHKYVRNVAIITLQGVDGLDNAVRMAQSYQGQQKVAVVMNRKDHFNNFKNTEQQMSEDPVLSKQILWLKDESSQEIDISSTKIREYVNNKQYEQLQDSLSEESIEYHVKHQIVYNLPKGINKIEPVDLMKLADTNIVKVIEYSQLKKPKDWQVILGKGLQGYVEQMIYTDDNGNETMVAVKKIKFNQARRKKLDTFAREVRALARINHNNVVHLYGVGYNDDYVFSVMEMCDKGISGWQFTREIYNSKIKDKFPIGFIKALSDLALGCAEMAHQGILHRDLTLDNILVFNKEDEIPVFKVCDFGVSATDDDKHLLPRGKTRNYSPEGIKDKVGYCSESDLYSFVLIIWEMAHNYYVWKQYTTYEANDQVVAGKLPEFYVTNCPQELVDLVMECLQFEKEKRPTFQQASERLNQIYIQYQQVAP